MVAADASTDLTLPQSPPQQVPFQHVPKRRRRGAIAGPYSEEALLCAVAAVEYSREMASREAQGAAILHAMATVSLSSPPGPPDDTNPPQNEE